MNAVVGSASERTLEDHNGHHGDNDDDNHDSDDSKGTCKDVFHDNNGNNIFVLILNLTYHRMIRSIVGTDDSKLLQEANLTAVQPRRAHITSFISFNKRCRLACEGVVNLTEGYKAQIQVRQHHTPRCYHYSSSPPTLDYD